MALIYANRSALKAALVSWLADGNFDMDTLDRAIALVEAQFRRRLRVFDLEKTVDLIIKGETLVAPSRYLAARVLYIPGMRPMHYLSPELLAANQADRPTPSTPAFYTLQGREDLLPLFRFSPLPDAQYVLRLTYTADAGLTGEDDCNSILDKWPDAYHYGCLSHLGDYVRNKERLPDWNTRFENAMSEIILSDLKDKVEGSTITPRSVYRGA